MPQFIVRTRSQHPDGSALNMGIIVVTAATAEAAKIDGANQLGTAPELVVVEPYV